MTRTAWSEEAPNADELRAAKLFEAAARMPVPAPPPFSALAGSPSARRVPRATGLKVVSAVLVGAGLALLAWRASNQESRLATQMTFRSTGSVIVDAPRVMEVQAAPPEPVQTEAPLAAPAMVRAAKPAVDAPAVDAPVVRRSTLGEEAALIASALQALRSDKNPTQAVSILLDYRARFPDGVLRPEALLAQAQAERALHHSDAALSLLGEAGPIANQKLLGELELTRGELLSEMERCEPAETAFTRSLETATGSIAERAAWGRARCAARRLAPEARTWLRAFLDAYPGSTHAADARDFLETLPVVK